MEVVVEEHEEEEHEEEEHEEEEACMYVNIQGGTGAGASGVNTGVNEGSVVKEGGGGGGVHLEMNAGSAVKEGAGARGRGADSPRSLADAKRGAGAGGSGVKGGKGVCARGVLGGCTGEFVGASGEFVGASGVHVGAFGSGAQVRVDAPSSVIKGSGAGGRGDGGSVVNEGGGGGNSGREESGDCVHTGLDTGSAVKRGVGEGASGVKGSKDLAHGKGGNSFGTFNALIDVYGGLGTAAHNRCVCVCVCVCVCACRQDWHRVCNGINRRAATILGHPKARRAA